MAGAALAAVQHGAAVDHPQEPPMAQDGHETLLAANVTHTMSVEERVPW